jgi:transposase-like protein
MSTAPKTLLDAVKYFADKDLARTFVAGLRWPNGVTCPSCESDQVTFLKTRKLWKCRECRKQFSVKVGTIFEDSPIGLDKWLPAMWMLVNDKNGISSYELGRALGVTQKTAWFMLHRIRLAMQSKTFKQMGGSIEVDETFIGGRARHMSKERKQRVIQGRRGGQSGKVAVMGLLQRHGTEDECSTVRTEIVPNVRRSSLQPLVEKHVKPGSTVVTDALHSYDTLRECYFHNVIDHAEAYAIGNVHTNGLENFWNLLKRCVRGTYVSVEPFHLFRYLDEQVFRFNNRKVDDAMRFVRAASAIFGKRLTYSNLTGAELSTT